MVRREWKLLCSDPLLDLQVSEGGFALLFWLCDDRTDEVQGTLSPPDSHLYSSRLPPTSQYSDTIYIYQSAPLSLVQLRPGLALIG